MRTEKIFRIGFFYFLFFVLLGMGVFAGKAIIDLKTLEMKAYKAEYQWVSLHETALKTFSFASIRAQYDRNRSIAESREDINRSMESWQVLQGRFETSLRFFETSPYKILLKKSTVKYIQGASAAWGLTKKKLQNSRNLFERIMLTPLGEQLVSYSYKELVEDAVVKERIRAGQFSKNDLLLFYRLQDSLGDLELSGGVFENVLEQISYEVSQRIAHLIILIAFLAFVFSALIVSVVIVMARRLRESHTKFQAIFDQTFQFTGLMTPEGVLLDANQTALDFVGTTAEKTLNRLFWETPWWQHSREAQDLVRAAVQRAARGEFVRQEMAISARDGAVGYVDFSIKPIRDKYQRVILLILEGRDITERKRAEDALRESEERFRAMADQAPIMIGVTDEKRQITFLNKKWLDFRGRTLEEEASWSWADGLHPEDRDRAIAAIESSIQRGEPYSVEYRLQDRQGNYHWMIDTAVPLLDRDRKPKGYIGTALDITDRKEVHDHLRNLVSERTAELEMVNQRLLSEIEGHKKTEMALEESRAYLDKIINSIADPIFVKDRNHAWILLNDVFCDFMGEKRDALIGKSDYDFFPKQEANIFWAKDEEVFNSGQENINEEFFTDGTGKTRTIVTKKTLYVDNAGNRILVGIIRDITEMRQQSIELRKAYEQLVAYQARMIQAEKMASLGQLAAGIAHEINNPTAYILCNLETLRDYEKSIGEFLKRLVALSPDLERHEKLVRKFNIPKILEDSQPLIDETIRGAERIKKIVLDLKVFAHPDTGGLEYGDLHHCIDSALGILGNEVRQKIELKKEYGVLPPVCFKEQQMLQVFINLLSNAAHAVDGQGGITIKTYATGKDIFAEVIDTGRGIPEEAVSKIFDPFYTTKPVGQGTGLGLSVVHGIIEQHQGTISVKSKVGEGTTFTIRLLQDGPHKKAA